MIDNQKDVSPVADSTLHFHGEIIKIKVFWSICIIAQVQST